MGLGEREGVEERETVGSEVDSAVRSGFEACCSALESLESRVRELEMMAGSLNDVAVACADVGAAEGAAPSVCWCFFCLLCGVTGVAASEREGVLGLDLDPVWEGLQAARLAMSERLSTTGEPSCFWTVSVFAA